MKGLHGDPRWKAFLRKMNCRSSGATSLVRDWLSETQPVVKFGRGSKTVARNVSEIPGKRGEDLILYHSRPGATDRASQPVQATYMLKFRITSAA